MNRHTHSFLITLTLYLCVAGFIIYASSNDNNCDAKSLDTRAARVCFSVISKEAPVQTPAPKEQTKVEKKVEKKKVVKRVEKKVEKVVQPRELIHEPAPKVVEEVAQEEVPEVVEEPVEMQELAESEEDQTETLETSTPPSDKAAVANVQKAFDSELMQAKRDMFMATLTQEINKNKTYPKSARRRGIEGNIEISFEICSNGNVDNITVISGKKAFKKSAIKAIINSFPIEVDSTLYDFPHKFTVTLAYNLI